MKMIEGLEVRQLLAPLVRVKSVVADNRGEVVIQLSERAVGVKGSAAQLYTAGADGKLFTSDDKRESVRFTYSENKKQIKLTAKLVKDTPYRVKLDGKTRIKSEADGTLLDGNFNGTFASGDGVAGGNFEVQFSRDKSSTPTATVKTSAGDFNIRLRGDAVPTTVSNFLSYANTQRYDGTVLHRNARTQSPPLGPLAILQGGGYKLSGTTFTHIDTSAPIPLEAGLPNVRATISMARTNSPDSATSEFFLNTADNRAILDPNAQSDGYAVFGDIVSGMAVVDTIYNGNTVAIGQFDAVPQFNNDEVTLYRVAALMVASAKA